MSDTETIYEGGCLCEAIRYTFRGPLQFVMQCCCKDCQKATGTGHTTIVGIDKAQLALTGEPKTFTVVGDSGNGVIRHFCGTCASRLYTMSAMSDSLIMIQSGTLDDPNMVTPECVIYKKDAVAWDRFDPDLPVFDALPPHPGA